jgi:AP-1 complex subunit gamma-1
MQDSGGGARRDLQGGREQFRQRNVAKLMYIHMLGYPTHFGQMECLKLISAASFPEKRIGYLALTLLLTESTEVLTLVTNSLKMDLMNPNQYIVALSLISIGNLATQDMARDLASDVEKILNQNNSYLRKKAALATIRLFKKEPDLIEHMTESVIGLLKDRAHGVLITGLQLIAEVIELEPTQVDNFRSLVPSLVRLLRNFITMGYSPEHDVGGIADPFLQVKLLYLLKVLGRDSEEASDHMNDVLAQVATNTETSKNSGNSILYECVQTIMEVQSDSGLRVLAVNILGRFLLNRDNNIRYVALNTLAKVVMEDVGAVQRHRSTITDCLKDSDISIRQRALELIFLLVNEQNVEGLVPEMLNYLVVAPVDHRAGLISKLLTIVEKFSPSTRWRVDTLVTMLSLSGLPEADDETTSACIMFLTQASGLHAYAVHRLCGAIEEDTSQLTLVHVAVWCIGEYADLLTRPFNDGPNAFPARSEEDVVRIVEKCIKMFNSDVTTKSIALNALIKATTRFSPACRQSIQTIIGAYQSSMSLELQQRSVEYSTLLRSQWDMLRGDLLAKMPVLDEAALRNRRGVFNDLSESSGLQAMKKASGGGGMQAGGDLLDPFSDSPAPAAQQQAPQAAAPAPAPAGGNSFLLDLDDIFGGGSPAPAPQAPAQQQQQSDFGMSAQATPPAPPTTDLLADIFSSGPAPTPAAPAMEFSGMSVSSPAPAAAPAAAGPAVIKAFEKNSFSVTMELTKTDPSNPSLTKIVCKFANSGQMPLSNFAFQVMQLYKLG